MVQLCMKWISWKLRNGCRLHPCRPSINSEVELPRTGAKADNGDIRIRGWATRHTRDTRKARWFAVELTDANAPWIGCKGETFRVVAAFELLATTFGILAVWPEGPGADGRAILGGAGITDNEGNGYVIARLMTTKPPLCAVLMELVEHLEARGSWLKLSWVPRQQN